MKIGFIGLGKLGLPSALAFESKGHEVCGYDINPEVGKYIQNRKIPYQEVVVPDLLKTTKLEFLSMKEVLEKSEIIFVPIQTPHHPRYDGTEFLDPRSKDFDYSFLIQAVRDIYGILEELKIHRKIIVISTVLPGTIERYIKPLLNEYMDFYYNPFFIAMGTVVTDIWNPEFSLIGSFKDELDPMIKEFYSSIHSKPLIFTSVVNAELIKVFYNTFIGMKINFANTVMEVSHKVGGNCDEVIRALSMADQRLISPKYLSGGMGDGGGCHPRDNIAMSWLSIQLGMEYDPFHQMMQVRQDQTEWLADLILDSVEVSNSTKVVILGKSFKPETKIVSGSPALLLEKIMDRKCSFDYRARKVSVEMVDPIVDGVELDMSKFDPSTVFFVATKHQLFSQISYPVGSTVVDPWRYVPQQSGVTVIHVGNTESSKKKIS